MEEKKTYYKEDLIEGAIEDLQERIEWCEKEKEEYEAYDLIHEIADNNIPIYTYDLLQYASYNFELNDPNEELCTEHPSVTQIIQANIYQWLSDHLHYYLNNTIQVKTEGENNEK